MNRFLMELEERRMRRIVTITGTALATACLAGSLLAAAPATSGIHVGELAVRLALAAGVRLPATAPERAAADYLAARGVILGSSLEALVLEGDLVAAARVLGATVTSSKPSSPATPAQSAAFIGAVRGALATDAAADDSGGAKEGDINASCQGRDSRAGRKGTPASTADPNATAPPCGGDDEPTP
jgi:hypothetical protein